MLHDIDDAATHVSGTPEYLLIQPVHTKDMGVLDDEVAEIARRTGAGFAASFFEVEEWNRSLMLWPDKFIDRTVTDDSGAREMLEHVGELIAAMQARFGALPVVLGGYSLAGLFSLWAAAKMDGIAAVAAASPSVWIEGWADYSLSVRPRSEAVYLSLGKREEISRNKHVAAVGDNLRRYYAQLCREMGEERVCLEWNEGGHFVDSSPRMASAFAWCISRLRALKQGK